MLRGRGAQEQPRAEAKGATPAPREAAYRAPSATAPGAASLLWPRVPGWLWRQALPWAPAPQQPEGSRLSPYGPDPVPEAPEEVWVPENAPAMQSCPQDKAPGPGGRGGRAAGHHWTPAEGTPGHRSGWAPMTRAPGPVLRLQQGQLCPGQAPTQDVTSACGCPLPAWALGGREPPRPAEPPSRQGPGLSRLGHPGWARPH